MPTGRASWRTTASTTPFPRSWTSSSLNSNSSYMPNQPSTKARNCRLAFEDVPQRPPLKDRIHSKAAHHRIDITAIPSLKLPAHTLGQVGGRGLLGHDAIEYPADDVGGACGRPI